VSSGLVRASGCCAALALSSVVSGERGQQRPLRLPAGRKQMTANCRTACYVMIIGAWTTNCALAQEAVRSVPDHAHGGEALAVVITIDAPSGIIAVGIEDSPPVGWDEISNVTNGGTVDAANHMIKWGPFFAPSIPTQVSYTIAPPIDASGENCFTGTASFNGFNEAIQGSLCVQATSGVPTVSEWGLAILGLLILIAGTLITAPQLVHEQARAWGLHPPSRHAVPVAGRNSDSPGEFGIRSDHRVGQKWVSRHVVATGFGVAIDLRATCDPRFDPQKRI